MHLSDLKVPCFKCLSSISVKVISMGMTNRDVQLSQQLPLAVDDLAAMAPPIPFQTVLSVDTQLTTHILHCHGGVLSGVI